MIQDIIEVETFTWMKEIVAANTGRKHYMIGNLVGRNNTLLVTPKGGNGGAVMFCLLHMFEYPIMDTCDECRNAVLPVAINASVTVCDTPEIQR